MQSVMRNMTGHAWSTFPGYGGGTVNGALSAGSRRGASVIGPLSYGLTIPGFAQSVATSGQTKPSGIAAMTPPHPGVFNPMDLASPADLVDGCADVDFQRAWFA